MRFLLQYGAVNELRRHKYTYVRILTRHTWPLNIREILTADHMGFHVSLGWILPPLSNSWIRITIRLYVALTRTNLDCYWLGAVPKGWAGYIAGFERLHACWAKLVGCRFRVWGLGFRV